MLIEVWKYGYPESKYQLFEAGREILFLWLGFFSLRSVTQHQDRNDVNMSHWSRKNDGQHDLMSTEGEELRQ